METKSRIVLSYASDDEVNPAMEKFFAKGGKITKIENHSQEILLKREIGEDWLNFSDPNAADPARIILGEAGNFIGQEVKALKDEVWISQESQDLLFS